MNKKRPSWIKKLRSHYRLLLINDTNFEEKAAIRLTPLTVIILISSGFLLFFGICWFLIYTIPPLRMYMPGYEPDKEKKFKREVLLKFKEYEQTIVKLEEKQVLFNILMRGDSLTQTDIAFLQDEINPEDIQKQLYTERREDSATARILFSEPSESVYMLNTEYNLASRMSGLFFPPLTGSTKMFFELGNYPYITIQTEKDETVKATLDGTIILHGWTPDKGNIICIQHPDNWVSIYKNCAAIYKKRGARVSAGEVIALAGKSEIGTNANKLHFELWHNGIPLNPSDFMRF